MTREELIEKVARSICTALPGTGNIDDHFAKEGYVKSMWLSLAEAAIDTIFDALKDPTEEMNDAARHLMLWQDGYNRPTYKNLKTHCRLLGKSAPDDCEDIDHVPPKAQRTSWIYQSMLAASPLAPEGKK